MRVRPDPENDFDRKFMQKIVWPDANTGALPWEEGYRHELRDVQPLLADGRQLN